MYIELRKGEKVRLVVFFRDNNPLPKKWLYVDNLEKFKNFLDLRYPWWVYSNVYAQNGLYMGRFYNAKNPLKG